MNKQKEFAIKVMELANAFTGWNFQMEQEENFYLVGTTLPNQIGQNMAVCYQIWKEDVQLTVLSLNSGYDESYVRERILAIPQGISVYFEGMGEEGFTVNSLMPIGELDSQTGTIVMERMADMIQAMIDITNHCK